MNTTDPSTAFVRRQYRRTRGTLLVWALTAALTAAAMTGAARLGWMKHGNLWAAIPAVGSVILLALWFRRIRGLSEARVAQELDDRWQLSARLESAVELSKEKTALASAQRTDAVQRVAGREPNTFLWSTGILTMLLALFFLGAEGTLIFWNAWRTAAKETAPTAPTAATPTPAEAAPVVESPAAITWKSPESEIKATPIEEVPLKALAESAAGFRSVTLEISVNGEHKLSQPLNPAALGDATKPGSHELAPLLALDEVGAKPFDIVSYHLVGERNNSPAKKPVSSPEQFIQIKPLTEDIADRGRVSEVAMRMRSLLGALKLAQLQLIQRNFQLAQLSEAKTDPLWKTENARTAEEQTKLAAQAAEAATFARENDAPALIDTNLTEAAKLMIDAGKMIAATDNEAARKPQGRALALIAECEKVFGKVRETEGPIPPPLPMSDPFRDTSKTELPPRAEGPAGELEQLAQDQRQANQQGEQNGEQPGQRGQGESQKQSPPQQSQSSQAGPAGGGTGVVIPSQDEIARDALKLADDSSLDSSVQDLTRTAANAAGAAARQIALGDRAAWREPAGTAQLALDQAVNALDKAGRELAVAELDQARTALNSASRTASAGDRARQLGAVRDELRAAAIQQQRTGSSAAARELASLADSINARPPSAEGSQPGSPERAREIASAAARAQVALGPRAATLNRAIRQLNRAQQNLSNGVPAGGPGETLATLETASQAAEWLTADQTTIETARQLVTQSDGMQRSPGSANPGALRDTAAAAGRLATALEHARNVGQRDEVVRRFKVEDIDPAYRPAVEAYFERLSREGAKAQPATPEQK
ncbi:MAG TPA: hypothetical protein VHO24_14200 [Opitutaceae bacterium]|nr:hypothetical protein [Opitutaceae bacterium]